MKDYYPGGMLMPGRSYSSTSYRFGFSGVEKDDEISGSGNHYEFKFRELDPRSIRFWSVDPLAKEYPWNSPYAYAENRMIDGTDLEGLEWADKTGKALGSCRFTKLFKPLPVFSKFSPDITKLW